MLKLKESYSTNKDVFHTQSELDIDPRRDDEDYPMSFQRMKVQWCKLVKI